MPHTIPPDEAARLAWLEKNIAAHEEMITRARQEMSLWCVEVETIKRVVKAFLPDGEDAAAEDTPEPQREGRRNYREMALQVVQDAPGLTADEITNTIAARTMMVTHKPRIADALVKLRQSGKVIQAEDDTWWDRLTEMPETPPAASPAVEADPGQEQAALEKPQEVALARKGSRVSTSASLKHTNPPKPQMSIDGVYDYLARSGDLGDFQIDHSNARDSLSALIARGDAETFEDHRGDRRYRLRQPPEAPE